MHDVGMFYIDCIYGSYETKSSCFLRMNKNVLFSKVVNKILLIVLTRKEHDQLHWKYTKGTNWIKGESDENISLLFF